MADEQHKFRDEELIFNIPLICSQGNIPYNEKHINYWKARAENAEKKLRELGRSQ